jgi:RNA polymerase sigma-70 factor (ECF subfamily)
VNSHHPSVQFALIDQTVLVRRAQKGDRRAFAALYDHYARLVRAIAYDACGDFSVSQDITQDVFLKAMSRLDQLKNAERFGAWISQIARRSGKDWRRSRSRDRHEFKPQPPDSPAAFEDNSSVELLQAIRRLPYRERMSLHIFYLDEQPAELARKTLGLSSSGFYKLLERARHNLANVLQKQEQAR